MYAANVFLAVIAFRYWYVRQYFIKIFCGKISRNPALYYEKLWEGGVRRADGWTCSFYVSEASEMMASHYLLQRGYDLFGKGSWKYVFIEDVFWLRFQRAIELIPRSARIKYRTIECVCAPKLLRV
jgi:hypothetical protein